MKDHQIITKCLLCQSEELKPVLSLAPTPPANQYVKEPREQTLYPLDLLQCEECQHVQISCLIDPDIMYKDYVYVSGTSAVTRKHFKDYASKIITNFNLNNESFVVDIGSNDGTLLSNFKEQNIKILGIDPAVKVAASANEKGILTWPKYFNMATALEIIDQHGNADIVTCNNMFAHNGNLHPIVEGIKSLLKNDGVFVFEVSYLMDVLDTTGFDLIYHEHIHQHHLTPLIDFFDHHEMEIFDVECINIQCGSIRVYVKKKGCTKHPKTSHVNEILGLEKLIPLKLDSFARRINWLRNNLMKVLDQYKSEGKTIVGYGAAAKATTSLHYFGIDKSILDAICDDSEWKIGLLTPGKHIPIVSPQYLYDKKPDVCLILSCNFAESIMQNHDKFQGTWIIPMPGLKVVNNGRK